MFPFRADCVNTILCLANLISARPGEQCARSSGSLGDFRLRVDHREGRIDVGLECAIENIGNKADANSATTSMIYASVYPAARTASKSASLMWPRAMATL